MKLVLFSTDEIQQSEQTDCTVSRALNYTEVQYKL